MRYVLVFTLLAAQAFSQFAVAQHGSPLKVAQHSEHLGALTREPMIIEVPGAGLFVTGYNRHTPELFQSEDHGVSWHAVNIANGETAAFANSDVDVACTKDGTIYLIALMYDPKRAEGTDINLAVSRDRGHTWHWHGLSHARFVDRPWIVVTPKGVAHAFWNDGSGVLHSMSADGGDTWSASVRIINKGGSSHAAVGPHGELAVRVTPASASGNRFDPSVDVILISKDDGKNWKQIAAPGERQWVDPAKSELTNDRWVEPVAWDEGGALYSLWTNEKGIWLARSQDAGSTWSQWLVNGELHSFYPYLSARADGQLAASWFTYDGNALRWTAAKIDLGRKGSAPNVHLSAPQSIEAWRKPDKPEAPPRVDTAGEYLPVIELAKGGIAVVVPIQNQAKQREGFSFWRFEEEH